MRVVAPVVKFAPGVPQALEASGHLWTAEYVGNSDFSYWGLLEALWAGETFCIVEQDVIIRPDSLDILEACPEPWCAWQVPYLGFFYAGLSCCKFDASLIAAVPDLMEQVGRMENVGHPPKHWCTLDAWIKIVLGGLHYGAHVHEPPLEHYREYEGSPWPTHDCHGLPPREGV